MCTIPGPPSFTKVWWSPWNFTSADVISPTNPTASVAVWPNPVPYGGTPSFTLTSTNSAYCYIKIDGFTTPYLVNAAVTSGTYYNGAYTSSGNHTASAGCFNSSFSLFSGWSTTNFTVDLPPTPTASITVTPNPVPYGGIPAFNLSSTNAAYCFIMLDNISSPYLVNAAVTSGTYYNGAYTSVGNHTAAAYCYNSSFSLWTGWVVTNFTVDLPSTPDLTTTFDSPFTATAGTAVTLSSTVSNTGTGSTGTSFSTLFEIDNTNNPALFTDINAVVAATSATLLAGGSNTAQASYTFPSAGTWYVRACADTNVSNVGSIVESNEGNNCSSPWVAVVVSPAPLISCDAAHVSSAWSTCSSSATCTYTPPQPSQLTGQIGTHYGFCPSPPYTSFPASEACYDAVVDCTLVSPPTTCGNDICEPTGTPPETTISCPNDCPVIVTEF